MCRCLQFHYHDLGPFLFVGKGQVGFNCGGFYLTFSCWLACLRSSVKCEIADHFPANYTYIMTVAGELVCSTDTNHRSEPPFYSINLSGWFQRKVRRKQMLFFYSPATVDHIGYRVLLLTQPVVIAVREPKIQIFTICGQIERPAATMATIENEHAHHMIYKSQRFLLPCFSDKCQHFLVSFLMPFRGCTDPHY